MKHKRKLIGAGLIGALIALGAGLPYALKPALEIAVRKNGFPKAKIGAVRFLADGLYIDHIMLDPNDFTSIDDLEIRGTWRDLILKRFANRVSAKKITLTGEIGKNNQVTIAGWDGGVGQPAPSGNQSFPFRSVYVDSVIADFDTAAGAIRVQGKFNMEGRHIAASIFSSQQQLTTTLNLNASLDAQRNLFGRLEIADTSIDIAPVSVSRLSGWIDFNTAPPFSAAGQIMAGGMKYNRIPFEDGNLTFDTSQAMAGIFKTKMTGQSVAINAELLTKPVRKIALTASAPNLGGFAALAEIKNDLLDKSGPATIKADVGLSDKFIPEPKINVAAITTSLAGGVLNIRPFTWYEDGRMNLIVMDLKKIQMGSFTNTSSPLVMDGSFSGSIPISYQPQNIVIKNGVLKSDAPGSFKYEPKDVPTALQGNDPRMETVRLALRNYHYDTLEILIDGPVNGNLKTALKAKGTSPALENRQVNLNLNLEGALLPAMTQTLQPGTLGGKLGKTYTEGKK